MPIISILILVTVALFGRWVQMHPGRIVGEGMFPARDSLGARSFRGVVAFLGSCAVFAGVYGALWNVLRPETVGSAGFRLMLRLMFAIAGIIAVIYVRKEVKSRPV